MIQLTHMVISFFPIQTSISRGLPKAVAVEKTDGWCHSFGFPTNG